MHLGLGEMVIVLVVALLVFGPTKLPQLGDALGKGLRNFKQAVDGHDEAPQRPAALPENTQAPASSAQAQAQAPQQQAPRA